MLFFLPPLPGPHPIHHKVLLGLVPKRLPNLTTWDHFSVVSHQSETYWTEVTSLLIFLLPLLAHICSPNNRCGVVSLFVFGFVKPHSRHMEVPRLGVESEPQLPAYATTAATSAPSHICKLHHSPQQYQILNPPSEARDRTRNLMVPSWIRFCCAMTGSPVVFFLIYEPHHMALLLGPSTAPLRIKSNSCRKSKL